MDTQSLHPLKSLFIRRPASRPAEKRVDPVPGFYKIMRFTLVTVSLILATPVSADEGYYLLAGIGASTTRIKSEYLVNSWNDTSDNLDFQF